MKKKSAVPAGVASDSQRSRVYCEPSYSARKRSACARTGERASERARVSERARCVCGSGAGRRANLGLIGVLLVQEAFPVLLRHLERPDYFFATGDAPAATYRPATRATC